MLYFKAVEKKYGDVLALQATDLHIASGETTVLIGPSGCGKSTVLRLIAGLTNANAGEIQFAGTTLSPESIGQLRRRMGYVIQEGGLFPHFTARRNVILMAQQLSWPVQKIETRLHELTELVQLPTKYLHHYPSELSGGQRQRISLMRALMLDPDLLLLDEPLGALDPINRYELQQELKPVFEKLHKTVVMVTHDIAEAAFFGHTVVLMRKGRIVQKGPYRELAHQPSEAFVSEFVETQRKQLIKLNEAMA